jgi:hypothetical protein
VSGSIEEEYNFERSNKLVISRAIGCLVAYKTLRRLPRPVYFTRELIMAAPLLLTSTPSVHGVIGFNYMNPLHQALELRSSLSQAFRFRTHPGRFGCMKAYGPNSSSSVSFAMTSVHAHLEELHILTNSETIPLNK